MPTENPAWELHDILQPWRITPNEQSVLAYRSENGDPANWWTDHARAVELLAQIDNHLEFLKRRNPNREPGLIPALDRIRRGIFATACSMEETPRGARRHFQDEDLQTLAATADGWHRLDASSESLREMTAVAHLARQLVSGADSLDDGIRAYLGDVINALEAAALEAAIMGGAPVGRLALELSAALEIYIPDSEANTESKRSVVTRLRKGAKDFVMYFAIPYASQLAATATMLAIQPGPTS